MTILMLEDEDERIHAFRDAVGEITSPVELVIWRDAPSMVAELPTHLPSADLISLDHDLNPVDACAPDPGTGMDVVKLLAPQAPVCPVILHTSNTNASWSMFNELEHHGWTVHRAPPIGMGTGWIAEMWLSQVNSILVGQSNSP